MILLISEHDSDTTMNATTNYWTDTATANNSASVLAVEHAPGFKLTQEERMKKFDEHKYGMCVSCDAGLDDRATFQVDPRFPRGFAMMCNACIDYYNKAGYVSGGYGPFANAGYR